MLHLFTRHLRYWAGVHFYPLLRPPIKLSRAHFRRIPHDSTVFMGTPEFAVSSLAALPDAGYEIISVLTKEDGPGTAARSLRRQPSDGSRAHGLTIKPPRTLRAAETRATLAGLART